MKFKSAFLATAFAATMICAATGAQAALINLGPGSFTPAASVITFSEVALGTQNPVYNLGGNTISFGPRFQGQSLSGAFPVTLSGSPTGPLTLVLDPAAPTFTVNDGSNPDSPVLSGTPTFNGPISIKFATPVAAVGMQGGFFNNPNSTSIEAFDANGVSLGIISNSIIGLEFYGLFDSTGSNIAGISFYVTGNEPAGFAIDSVTFGDASVIRGVPEPLTMSLFGAGLVGAAALRRRKKA